MKRKETELLNDNVAKKNKQKISFEISGDDYIKFKVFERTHKRCIDNYPDVSGAQYEFSFIPSGLGVFKTVTCSCGETLLLHSDIFGEAKNELNY